MIIRYLGPEGSFSHAAGLELLKRFDEMSRLVPLPNIESVVRSVHESRKEVTIGLVPYYNFLEGLVQEHLDLIYQFRLKILGVVRLPILFSAGTFDNPLSPSTEIFSHPKALAQVSDFIQLNFGNAIVSPVSSTSEAAKLVAEKKSGVAIASDTALEKFGVPVFAKDIGNLRHGKRNFTDFFVVKNEDMKSSFGLDHPNHTMIAITPKIDRPGLLAEILGQFHFYGLDIAKIHSRPAIDLVEGSDEPQMFYLEIKRGPISEPLLKCAESIRYRFGHSSSSDDPVRIMGGFKV